MEKLQDSVFSIIKTTNLSPAVFNYLQPTDDFTDITPLGGILSDTNHGWLALGPKFCVIDLRTGLKLAAWTFSAALSTSVTSVVELPTPLTDNSKQLLISLECEGLTSIIVVFHVNGSLVLRCLQTEAVVTQLAVCVRMPDGPFTCFDGVVMAGTKSGEIFAFDLNISSLQQALKDISLGEEHLVKNEQNMANITFLPQNAIRHIVEQRELAMENDDHLGVVLNEHSLHDSQQYLFYNPDGTIRMKAKKDHIRVSTMQYIPQLGSLAVGYNFGAFQIWNVMTLELEFTSQINVECLPVTHFGFQEPCDDPRAFCYLWVVYSLQGACGGAGGRDGGAGEEPAFPLAAMFSLTYLGKRMLTETMCLYQEFSTCNMRFQVELCPPGAGAGGAPWAVGGRCVSCHAHSVSSTLGEEGEDSMLNIIQLVWEWWDEQEGEGSAEGEGEGEGRCALLLFDLDQWYKAQMPATCTLQDNTFISVTEEPELSRSHLLDVQIVKSSVAPYLHATRLEEHFYPNSLQYKCVSLGARALQTALQVGVQRAALARLTPPALLRPAALHALCRAAGLLPASAAATAAATARRGLSELELQRRDLLTVALEARLPLLKRLARAWAAGAHAAAGCCLAELVDWCWQRALELKETAKDLTTPLFMSSGTPDRNVLRLLGHCVRQLSDLNSLLDCILTKCCNLVVPEALSSMEEQQRGVRCISVYLAALQWTGRAQLLAATTGTTSGSNTTSGADYYTTRRIKLSRLADSRLTEKEAATRSCPLLYIDQLIVRECGGELITRSWSPDGEAALYPPASLGALLRVYLEPSVPERHKHRLVLYALLDHAGSLREESMIRRLMQFPTLFAMSNADIKTTQAFWHLDHRDFDFALEQIQWVSGSALGEWEQSLALSALLLQNRTQQALRLLLARPQASDSTTSAGADVEMGTDTEAEPVDGEFGARCSLLVSRSLLEAALHAARKHSPQALEYFFDACRRAGQLSLATRLALSAAEGERLARYLRRHHLADLLVMYYLQQDRYIEAQQYNRSVKSARVRQHEPSSPPGSALERESAREVLVEAVCGSLPLVTGRIARAITEFDDEKHVTAPKPLSVFVQAKSPKNTFTYKSSFIQETIENARETWTQQAGPTPRTRGVKRALCLQDTPFLCTPSLARLGSALPPESEATPPKRPRAAPSSPGPASPAPAASPPRSRLQSEIESLLNMPVAGTPPEWTRRGTGRDTPHSILKIRRSRTRSRTRSQGGSPTPSRTSDTDDSTLDLGSHHTASSDAKHLRFTIPTASESDSTPSPPIETIEELVREQDDNRPPTRETEMDIDQDDRSPVPSRSLRESRILESPPKQLAREDTIKSRKSYKDSVRARQSLSVSHNSSLSEEANSSVESIADIPFDLVNRRYHARHARPRGSTPDPDRSPAGGDKTTERLDSPVPRLASIRKLNRSRSRTPELAAIPERAAASPRRSRSPILSTSPAPAPAPAPAPPQTRSRVLRSRSRTPEVETPEPTQTQESPRSLRSRSKTPDRETIMSPIEKSKTRKSLSRMVLEHNAFSKAKPAAEQAGDQEELNTTVDKSLKQDNAIECTPMKKNSTQVGSLLDVTLSPIVNKSVLQSSVESVAQSSDKKSKSLQNISKFGQKSFPAFTTLSETFFDKSVLKSYQSSVAEDTTSGKEQLLEPKLMKLTNKTLEISSVSSKSVLKDVSSLMTSDSDVDMKDETANVEEQREKQKIVEIEREIHEIEVETSDDGSRSAQAETTDEEDDDEENEEEGSIDGEEESSIDGEEESDDSTGDANASEEDVISIGDSSEEASFDSDNNESEHSDEKCIQKIDIKHDVETCEEIAEVQVEVVAEIDPSVGDSKDQSSAQESVGDPLNQAAVISIMTDDNSMLESDHSDVNLNYSDESKEVKKAIDEQPVEKVKEVIDNETKVGLQIVVEVSLDKKTPDTVTSEQVIKDVDVVDAVNPAPATFIPTTQVIKERILDIKEDKTIKEREQESKEVETVSKVEKEISEKEKQLSKKDKEIRKKETDQESKEVETVSKLEKDISEKEIELSERDKEKEIRKKYTEQESKEVETVSKLEKDISEKEKVLSEKDKEKEIRKKDTEHESKEVETVSKLEKTVSKLEKDISEKEKELSKRDKEKEIRKKHTEQESKEVETVSKLEKDISEKEKVLSEKDKEKEIRKKDTEHESKEVETVSKLEKTVSKLEKDISEKEKELSKRDKEKEIRKKHTEQETNEVETVSKLEKDISEKEKDKENEIRKKEIDVSKPEMEGSKKGQEFSKEEKEMETDQMENKVSKKGQESCMEEMPVTEEIGKVKPSRKRTTSTSSNKSHPDDVEALKTPSKVKRTKSTSSNISETQVENLEDTPSRRRAKTPTSTEVRRILTRRASKELSESKMMDESQEINESLSVTPKRRSTRSKSKNLDDNASVASESSVKSTRSKSSVVSEEGDRPIRKSRKSLMMTKPDLPVIPEISTGEGSSKDGTQDILNEYSTARRLTRHQKSLLLSWLEHKPESPAVASPPGPSRRTARALSVDVDSDNTSEQNYDRMQLLNKPDFQARLTRAASEGRATAAVAATRALGRRRGSVDLASVQASTPPDVAETRRRRASFNKACEAFATPRQGRRPSVGKRGETDSMAGSPVLAPSDGSPEVTPPRRPRRALSTQSNASQRSDSSRKSKKGITSDENKDTK